MCNLGKPAAAPDQLPERLLARLDQALKRMADGPAAEIETPLTVIRHPRLAVCHYLELLMAYLLPRTILVVIAWGVTCALIRRICRRPKYRPSRRQDPCFRNLLRRLKLRPLLRHG